MKGALEYRLGYLEADELAVAVGGIAPLRHLQDIEAELGSQVRNGIVPVGHGSAKLGAELRIEDRHRQIGGEAMAAVVRGIMGQRPQCEGVFVEVLRFIDLARLADEYAGKLSGGQKKLLELGRTLMAEPKLVLLDEPGAGVNRTLMKRLVENIEYLRRERGITFLLIEHDMDLVMNLCDPVIVMSEGHQLMEGRPDEVQRDPRVLEAYLGGQYAVAEG